MVPKRAAEEPSKLSFASPSPLNTLPREIHLGLDRTKIHDREPRERPVLGVRLPLEPPSMVIVPFLFVPPVSGLTCRTFCAKKECFIYLRGVHFHRHCYVGVL